MRIYWIKLWLKKFNKLSFCTLEADNLLSLLEDGLFELQSQNNIESNKVKKAFKWLRDEEKDLPINDGNSKSLNIKVLIVEDYSLTRYGLRQCLEGGGFTVYDVDSAEEALLQFDKLSPDIILMDLGLPGLNGVEATKIIKSKRSKVKIIALTSHEGHNEVKEMLNAKADGYFLKTLSPPSLVKALLDVYNGAILIDPQVNRKIPKDFYAID